MHDGVLSKFGDEFGLDKSVFGGGGDTVGCVLELESDGSGLLVFFLNGQHQGSIAISLEPGRVPILFHQNLGSMPTASAEDWYRSEKYLRTRLIETVPTAATSVLFGFVDRFAVGMLRRIQRWAIGMLRRERSVPCVAKTL